MNFHVNKISSGFYICLIGMSLFVFVSSKNISVVLYVISFLLATISLYKKSSTYRRLSKIFLCLSVLAVFSLFDVDIRYGDKFEVKKLPVIYAIGSWESVRELEDQKLQQNKDFIITNYPAWPYDVQTSYVFFLPSKTKHLPTEDR